MCMLKLCVSSISKLLHLIFRNCIETDSFPKEWKKANIIPVHKLSFRFLWLWCTWKIVWVNSLIFIWQMPMSFSQWSNFKRVANHSWWSTRFSSRTLIIFKFQSNVKLFVDDRSRWCVTLLLHHYVIMRSCPKYHNVHTNEKYYLILMLQNKLKKLFSHAKKS